MDYAKRKKAGISCGGLRNKGITKKSKDGKPLVSIITPVFNGKLFLAETIESVIRQTYENIEYIVIDGGSTDGSVSIIKKYEKYLAYWVSEKDNGQADAINKGWKISQGSVLAYLNSDDLYEPNAVKLAAECLQSDLKIEAVYGLCRIIDAQERLLSVWNPADFNIKTYLRLGVSSVPQQTFFFKRSALARVGYLDISLKHAMDYDFIARVGQAGSIRRLPHVMASFRLHSDSKTVSANQFQRNESSIVQQRYLHESVWLTRIGRLAHKLRRILPWFVGGPYPLFSRILLFWRARRRGIKI